MLVSVGNRIKTLRKEKRLSQEALAHLCDLHPTYIGQIERGEKNASLETMAKVAHGLDLPLSTLLDVGGNDTSQDVSEVCRRLLLLSEEKRAEVVPLLLDIIKLSERG